MTVQDLVDEIIIDSFAGGGGTSEGIVAGFRTDYIIDRGILEDGTEIKFTAEQQGYMCGNSVCPPEAEDLIRENYQPRKVRRPRTPVSAAPLLEAAAS